MDPWLTAARDAVAGAAGIPAARLDLDDAEASALLDVARIAAHTSGDRTNAPLLSYLVGVAVANGGDLEAVVSAVRHLARTEPA